MTMFRANRPVGSSFTIPAVFDLSAGDLSAVPALEARYAQFGGPASVSTVWSETRVQQIDPDQFRGDNPFVYRSRDGNSFDSYRITYEYAKAHGSLGLFDKLSEDGSFGVETVELDGRLVSRDLLDTVGEIEFLNRHIGSDAKGLLDIGAGYGRLVAGVAASGWTSPVIATDAVPLSTVLCQRYIRHKGLASKVQVAPLDKVGEVLSRTKPNVATNVHSFSEMPESAVRWWTQLLQDNDVEWLLVVPGRDDPGSSPHSMEPSGRPAPLTPAFAEYGYELVASEPKYLDPEVQARGVSPTRR